MVRDSAAKRREGEILTCILRTHTLNKLDSWVRGCNVKRVQQKHPLHWMSPEPEDAREFLSAEASFVAEVMGGLRPLLRHLHLGFRHL